MHPNAATLTRFCTNCAVLDHATMVKCYAPEAQFQYPAFTPQGQNEVAGIWRMLCEATRAKGLPYWKLEFSGVEAVANTVHFHVCVVAGAFEDEEGLSGNP